MTFSLNPAGVRGVQSAITSARHKLSAAILADMKSAAPRRTGALADSLEIVEGETSDLIGSDLDYSVYVEMGTENMAAQPYMRPALYKQRSE